MRRPAIDAAPNGAQLAGEEVLHLVEGLAGLAVDHVRLCRGAGIDAATLPGSTGWFEVARVASLLRAAARELDDPCLGLHLAERVAPHGFVHYLVAAQATPRRSLDRLERFQQLCFDRPLLAQRTVGDACLFAVARDADEATEALLDYWLATVCINLRRSTAPELYPVELWLRGTRPAIAEYERVFGCRVRTGRSETAVIYPARALDHPLTTGNAAVAARLEEVGAVMLEAATARTFDERVRAVIRSLQMTDRPCERDATAQALGLSGRTLQRRLEAEGVNFRALLDEMRRDAALALIADPSVLISDIAARCSFSDEAAFNRAFHRWTGQAPRAYRRRIAAN